MIIDVIFGIQLIWFASDVSVLGFGFCAELQCQKRGKTGLWETSSLSPCKMLRQTLVL